MTRDPITDPEVIADLRLRAASERSRGNGDPTLSYRAPVLVEQWPCRGKCGATVPVDEAGVHARNKANAQLARRGEPELGKHEIAFCPACKAKYAPARGDAMRRHADAMAAAIRELKTLVDNDLRERALIARLRELGHPDVDGLVRAVREGRAAKNNTTRRSL
jgi:hypothetical protein